MTTRRTFIQRLAVLPSALSLGSSWATSSDPSRQALVIGNSSYRESPLLNPVNDARAMSGLLEQAGFGVATHLDAARSDMLAAIDRFGAAVRKSDTRLVVFYYAGHGVQLDWRNYLLPVDAQAQTTAQLRESCIDLNALIGQFGKARDKTFVIILDACRNNPFGSSYQPEQKGLSQFDAPVGSLLAYATSPGNVASDGSGQNGLYTENLVRELSVQGARIEDALKRVRLNVRLTSGGAQIPWETTSLESDVYIVGEGKKKLSEAEQERQLEADLAAWGRIKTSEQVDDWVAYLRQFPNGRFAEIAQSRLSRLLAHQENKAQIASAAVAPAAVATPTPAQVIELGAGLPVPQMLQTSANPYSAGRYPLGRKYSVGDTVTYRVSDLLTDVEAQPRILRVTRIDTEKDVVEINQGSMIVDMMGNPMRTPGGGDSDVPQQLFSAELQLGKAWRAGWKQNGRWGPESISMDLKIAAFEKVRVPAGEFEAFRIDIFGWIRRSDQQLNRQMKLWVVPGLNFVIRNEHKMTNQFNRMVVTERQELVSLRQQTIDTKCAVATGAGLHRNLVIRNSCV